ncbi:hypothetical protein LXT21_33840 [Myxococcus sp. K38C18041901]|uniref:leucine-rich repeat domain-containing protein n=1 Tax=Myxococcus guangdongensis TaxID=2906760 RepID=UPI0020A75F66|nr:hypothetical protein [Myxococcus guangdongensis]MCP3063769.1 hypothetical protein [Myxococcus guangdongensis]
MDFVDLGKRTVLEVADDVVDLELPRLDRGGQYASLGEKLQRLSKLESLRLHSEQSPEGLEALRGLSGLKVLGLTGLTSDHDLAPLATCSNLRTLRLVRMEKVDLAPLEGLTRLETLVLFGSAKNLKALAGLTKLSEVQILFNPRVPLEVLSKSKGLKQLSLRGSKATGWEHLSRLEHLEVLDLGNTNITSIGELPGLPGLRTLEVDGCRALHSLAGVERFPGLTRLSAENLKKLDTLKPVAALKKLEVLWLIGTPLAEGDAAVLAQLPLLSEVRGVKRRPEVAEQHGSISILKDTEDGAPVYRVDQMLAPQLELDDHEEVEEWLQRELGQSAPGSLEALEFDSEGEHLVVRSSSLEALRTVAMTLDARLRGADASKRAAPKPRKRAKR